MGGALLRGSVRRVLVPLVEKQAVEGVRVVPGEVGREGVPAGLRHGLIERLPARLRGVPPGRLVEHFERIEKCAIVPHGALPVNDLAFADLCPAVPVRVGRAPRVAVEVLAIAPEVARAVVHIAGRGRSGAREEVGRERLLRRQVLARDEVQETKPEREDLVGVVALEREAALEDALRDAKGHRVVLQEHEHHLQGPAKRALAVAVPAEENRRLHKSIEHRPTKTVAQSLAVGRELGGRGLLVALARRAEEPRREALCDKRVEGERAEPCGRELAVEIRSNVARTERRELAAGPFLGEIHLLWGRAPALRAPRPDACVAVPELGRLAGENREVNGRPFVFGIRLHVRDRAQDRDLGRGVDRRQLFRPRLLEVRGAEHEGPSASDGKRRRARHARLARTDLAEQDDRLASPPVRGRVATAELFHARHRGLGLRGVERTREAGELDLVRGILRIVLHGAVVPEHLQERSAIEREEVPRGHVRGVRRAGLLDGGLHGVQPVSLEIEHGHHEPGLLHLHLAGLRPVVLVLLFDGHELLVEHALDEDRGCAGGRVIGLDTLAVEDARGDARRDVRGTRRDDGGVLARARGQRRRIGKHQGDRLRLAAARRLVPRLVRRRERNRVEGKGLEVLEPHRRALGARAVGVVRLRHPPLLGEGGHDRTVRGKDRDR